MDSPLKILVVTTSFPLTAESSSGIFVQRLIKSYPGSVKVTVLVPDCSEKIDLEELNKLHNYTIKTFRYAPKKYQLLAHNPGGIPAALKYSPWLYLILPSLISNMFLSCIHYSRKNDLIHANWSINGFIGGLTGYITNTPSITTIRGSDIKRAENNFLDKMIMQSCICLNRNVVCVSNDICTRISKLFRNKKYSTTYIPNGVESKLLAITRKEVSKDNFYLVTIGNLISLKSIHTIIDALVKCIKCRLIIIGDGPEKDNLATLAKNLSISDRIIFKGNIKPDQIFFELQKADIFIMASKSEGRPNVIIEAMAAGLPVIASRITAHEEIIKHEETGLLFELDNVKELESSINKLSSDHELLYRLGNNARQSIIDSKLTWENSAEDYIKLYKNCLSEN